MTNERDEVKRTKDDYKMIGEIFAKYEVQLGNYAKSKLADQDKSYAEDVVQTCFEVLLRYIDKIDIYDEMQVCSFLWVVAKNESHNYFRRHQRYYCVEPYKLEDKCLYFQSEDSRINFEDLMDYVRQLPSKYADVLILSGVLELTNEEISDILNIQRATVRQRIRRARFKIKSLMAEKSEL